MKKLFAVAAVLFIMALAPTIVSAGQLNYQEMKFFESGYGLPDYNQRTYLTMFTQSGSRYINCEVNFKNPLYNVRDQNVNLTLKYYYPNGSLFGTAVSNATIKSEWDAPWIATGYGWADPGKWTSGPYRVEAFLDGVYIGQSSFTIYDSMPRLRFTTLKFFESGYGVPAYEQRNYTTYFSQSATRYVNFEVSFINDLYMVRDQLPILTVNYYSPDGSFFGTEMVDTVVVKKEWYNSWLSGGYGWQMPGNWKRGTYRVEVFLGSQKITEGRFTIN